MADQNFPLVSNARRRPTRGAPPPHRATTRRLACYGPVEEAAGSVASANHTLLYELLRSGVEVDLFADASHIPLPTKLVRPEFRFFGMDRPAGLQHLDKLPQSLSSAIQAAFSPWLNAGLYSPFVRARHRSEPYDAVLSLGTAPAFHITGVPTITWLQSPFHTEFEAVRRLRTEISAVSGRAFYLKLNAYYRGVRRFREAAVRSSDTLILGSEWSRSAMLAAGSPVSSVHVLPYPIDLKLFSPRCPPAIDAYRPLLLSLGRHDPRKRLDLLLDAFAHILEAIPKARLRIIGRPGYAPNQLSLIERCRHRDQIEYMPFIPRHDVPDILREATVLIQASENENFGSAVAEALACGVPVVVGPLNGTGEYVDNHSRVFEAYEARRVADATLNVLGTLADRPHEVHESTRASAQSWFSPAKVARQLMNIVEATIAARGAQ